MARLKASSEVRGNENPAFRSFVESILNYGTSPGQPATVLP
jgi:hypothetical protein